MRRRKRKEKRYVCHTGIMQENPLFITQTPNIIHSILPLNQLNNPFVPSLSHTLLCGTRNLY
jgi:hypothetical protein